MYCAHCGTPNGEGSAFCHHCGQPLQAAGGGYPYRQPQAPAYQQPRPAPEGVLGAAWRDITGTRGWFKKVLFLCLVGCVPVLNLSVEGYALRWSRELSFGERNPLPKEVFRKREILTGFRAWLVKLSLGFVYGILAMLAVLFLSGLFGLIGAQAGAVAGGIASVLLLVGFVFLFLPVINAAILRMAVTDYLESAFNLPQVIAAFKRSMGGAVGAAVVPLLVVGLIQLAVGAVFGAIAGSVAASSLPDYSILSHGYMAYGPMAGLSAMGSGMLFCYVLLDLLFAMLSTFGMLLTWRAMGHWTARNAGGWANEPEDEAVLMGDDGGDGRSFAAEPAPAAGAAAGLVPPASQHRAPAPGSVRPAAPAPAPAPAAAVPANSARQAPAPAPVAAPQAAPAPDSAPMPQAEPPREPASRDVPVPAPEPTPAPAPVLAPEPAPEPVPVPEPAPMPADPAFLDAHAPAPEGPMESARTQVIPAAAAQDSPIDNRQTARLGAEPGELVLTRRSTGAAYRLVQLPVTLGKGAAADVIIDGNESVSRVHARIARSGDAFTVEDMNTTNGTMLNGMPVMPGVPVAFGAGDILHLSDEEFAISVY